MAPVRRPLASCANLLRPRTSTTARASYGRHIIRQTRTRGYASASQGGATIKSDLPWLATSLALTAPTLWYIGVWKPDPNAHHGHDEHEGHDAEEGEAEEKEESESKDEETDEQSKEDAADDANSDENQKSSKQEGTANADTQHSTEPDDDSSQSDKPEGGLDTSKTKDTVDTDRKQK